jgi:hypothetical protein
VPVQREHRHANDASNIACRRPIAQELLRRIDLILCRAPRPTAHASSLPRRNKACARPLPDQSAFKLGQSAEYMVREPGNPARCDGGRGRSGLVPGQNLGQPVDRMTIGHAVDDVGKLGLETEPVELRCLQHGVERIGGSISSDNALDHSYLDPVEFSDLVDGHSVTRQRSNAIVLRSGHLGPPPDRLSS